MKKLLGIVFLGLLLSGNAYAASKIVYLSCPQAIVLNQSKGKHKDSELYKVGSHTGHYFIKFKDSRKDGKLTPVTLYSQGNKILPSDPDLWMSFPPEKLFKTQFVYSLDAYFFPLEYENIQMNWHIGRDYDLSGDEIFVVRTDFKLDGQGIEFFTTSNYLSNAKKVFDNIDFCKALDKKEFKELIKKGIK